MKPVSFKPPRKVVLSGILLLSNILAVLSGCSTAGKLHVSAVTYQSINTKKPQSQEVSIPYNAKILATYAINQNGQIGVIVKNLTDEILTIDQERSFFINTSGESHSYFDPNVYSSTQTNYSFGTTGTSVNLGPIASALGIGGQLGTLLGGIGVNPQQLEIHIHTPLQFLIKNRSTLVLAAQSAYPRHSKLLELGKTTCRQPQTCHILTIEILPYVSQFACPIHSMVGRLMRN